MSTNLVEAAMRKLTLHRASAVLALAAALRLKSAKFAFPIGAGGVGFLPLLVMQKYGLIEQYAKQAGIERARALDQYRRPSGDERRAALRTPRISSRPVRPPSSLCGTARITSAKVKGVAAMTSLPMYLNTRSTASEEARRHHGSRPHRRHFHQSLHPVARHADVREAEIRRRANLPVRQIHCHHDASRRRDRAAFRIGRRRRPLHLASRSPSASSRTRIFTPF